MKKSKRLLLAENIRNASRDIWRGLWSEPDYPREELVVKEVAPEKKGVWVAVTRPDSRALEWVGMTEEEWKVAYLRRIVEETRINEETAEWAAHTLSRRLRNHLN